MHSKASPLQAEAPSRAIQTRELGAFLFLIVPSLVLSRQSAVDLRVGFVTFAISTICSEAALLILVAYFLWRNGESARLIGWTRRKLGCNLLLGIVLFLPISLAIEALLRAAHGLGVPLGPPAPEVAIPATTPEFALGVVLVAVVAVTEEVVFRGYLLRRLRSLTGNTSLSILLATALFALGHRYEGASGLLAVSVLGIAFAVVYLRTRSLAAVIVMHFLQDFVAIVLLPMLKLR
jgi:membrane protease YdiL (CAAX protease family)